jgi:trehalose 6-phosphate phosphatase
MQDLLEPLRSSPDDSGILLDFDGTLSPIVDIPSEAAPLEGVGEVLEQLADRYRAVAVVSGRSAQQLLDRLGSAVDIWGVHGAERVVDGAVTVSSLAAEHETLMSEVLAETNAAVAKLGLTGVLVEDKRVVVVLHYRAAPNRAVAADAVTQLAQLLAEKHGLTTAAGRLALELRPPLDLSKGHVVTQVVREAGLMNALFAGDDLVDLSGFDALDEVAARGGHAVRVAVRSEEAPPQLLERADLTVDGPAGVAELLQRLL